MSDPRPSNTVVRSREISLMSVDLPLPLGPRMATCSPCPMASVTPSNTTRGPRSTVTFSNSISGMGGTRPL